MCRLGLGPSAEGRTSTRPPVCSVTPPRPSGLLRWTCSRGPSRSRSVSPAVGQEPGSPSWSLGMGFSTVLDFSFILFPTGSGSREGLGTESQCKGFSPRKRSPRSGCSPGPPPGSRLQGALGHGGPRGRGRGESRSAWGRLPEGLSVLIAQPNAPLYVRNGASL